MAEIPAAQSIATPAPRPALGTPEEYPRQIYRPGEASDALAGLGAGITQDATRELDEQDQLQFATARSSFLQQKAGIESSLQHDPDWATIPQRYSEAMTKARSAAAGAIQNPKYQATFAAQAGLDTQTGLAQMQNLAYAGKKDAATGSLLNTLDTNRRTALESPQNAPALIQATLGALSGYAAQYPEEASRATEMRQRWTADYGKGWASIQTDAQQVKLLKDPTAKTGTPADFIDPAERMVMGREAERRLKTDQAVAQQQFSQNVADQVAYLRNGGDPSKVTVSSAQARAVYGGTAEGTMIADEIDRAVKYNGLARELALAPQSQVNQILQGNVPASAANYRANAQDFNDLRDIAAHRTQALTNDPASYAVAADPATGAAYLAASKGPQQFDAYVQRLNGTYSALELPADQRSILPKGDAANTVKSLNTVAPAAAVQQFDQLKSTAGRWWPQVYAELGRAGLPPAFQAVTIASPQDAQVMIAAMQTGKGHAPVGSTIKQEDKQAGGTIDTTLDENSDFQNLRGSLTTYGRSGIDLFNGARQAVRTTAMYLMDQNPSLSAQDASARAASMVTGAFDFMSQGDHPPARLPRGTLDTVTAQAAALKSGLTSNSVQPYPDPTMTTFRGPLPSGTQMPGSLHLNPAIAPHVPLGAPRPLAPGEWNDNPNGSWSSEISATVQDKSLNRGRPTVIPTMWIANGKPIQVSEDDAIAYARASGLKFKSFDSMQQAEAFANAREASWQPIVNKPDAAKIAPLYENPDDSARAAGLPTYADRAAAALHGAQNGWWLTVPASDGGTILRLIDAQSGMPVVRANGQRVDLKVNSANLGTVGPAAPPSGAPQTAPPTGAADVPATGGIKLPAAPALRTGRRGRR